MKQKILALCATLGLAVGGDATDEQAAAGLDRIGEKATLAATLANEKSILAGERDAARAGFAGERAGHIAALLDAAVADGRITGADRPAWAKRLGNESNFANEQAALRGAARVIKTSSITITRGERKAELASAQDRREIVAELINEVCRQEGLDIRTDYDRAFARVQRRFPQLFEAMRQPPLAPRNA